MGEKRHSTSKQFFLYSTLNKKLGGRLSQPHFRLIFKSETSDGVLWSS